MKTITYFIPLFLFLTACSSTPHIHYNNNIKAFELTHNNEILLTQDANQVFQGRVNLPHINIYQYIYKLDNGDFAVYEQAYTHPYYIFDKSIDVLISKIFPDYNVKRSARVANLYFYTLDPKLHTDVLYMVVENQNKKLLKIMYSKDKSIFERLLKNLDTNAQFANFKIDNNISTKHCHLFIKSKWNYKNILFSDLVKREGGRRKRVK
jgi:hypothetical protein